MISEMGNVVPEDSAGVQEEFNKTALCLMNASSFPFIHASDISCMYERGRTCIMQHYFCQFDENAGFYRCLQPLLLFVMMLDII